MIRVSMQRETMREAGAGTDQGSGMDRNSNFKTRDLTAANANVRILMYTFAQK